MIFLANNYSYDNPTLKYTDSLSEENARYGGNNRVTDTASEGSSTSSDLSGLQPLISKYLDVAQSQTDAQNQLQLQMMRETNALTKQENALTRQFNSAEAEKAFMRSEQSRIATQEYNTSERLASQEWQEYMSGSQYQRAVKDLYAAGLNPLLAVGAQASYGNVSPGRSSASNGAQASSRSSGYNSASAYRVNVEGLIGSILGYLTDRDRVRLEEDKYETGMLGKILGGWLF